MNENQDRLAECLLAILESEEYETVAAGDQTLTPQDLQDRSPQAARSVMDQKLPDHAVTALQHGMNADQYTREHLKLEDQAFRIAQHMDGREKQALLEEMGRRIKAERLGQILHPSKWLNQENLLELICEILEEDRSEDPRIAGQVGRTLGEHQPSDTLMLLIDQEQDRLTLDQSVKPADLDDRLEQYDPPEQLAQEIDAELELMALEAVGQALGTERRDQARNTLLEMRGYLPEA